MPGSLLGIQLESVDAGASLFVGVGPADDVATYLDQVAHDEISEIDDDPLTRRTRRSPGGEPAAEPAAQSSGPHPTLEPDHER